jgi:hypothetical protein
MTKKEKKEKTPEETLQAIREQQALDELERVKKLTEEELDEEIREDGGDPERIGQRIYEKVQDLEAQRRRDAWLPAARERMRRAHEIMGGPGPKKTRGLTREQLLARIEAASQDPRLTGKIAVAYRDKKLEARTDAELEAMLDGIEDLAELTERLD